MANFDITGDFRAAPLGPLTEANKQLVWGGRVTQDFDRPGNRFSIVEDSRFAGGRAQRMQYPKGKTGMNDQSYGIRIPSPKCPVAIEFDWLFEPGFQFYNKDLNPPNGGGGKLGPVVNWGEIGGQTEKRGTRCMMWWNAYGSMKPKPCLNPSCQDQRSGDQLVQPVVYTAPIVINEIIHFKIEVLGGPPPLSYAKYWMNNALIAHVENKHLQVTAEDDVIIDFAYFAGGPNPDCAPTEDIYARNGNIRYWSVGAAVEPPSDGGLTVTIDGVSYSATGALTLTRKG